MPDIVASMTDLGDIGPFDTVYSAHSLEHVTKEEADTALREFHRVLGAGGCVMIFVPDIEDIRPTLEVVYESPAGPVTGIDMIYGMPRLGPFMGHKTGFIAATLEAALLAAGFARVKVARLSNFNLFGVGIKE